MLTIDELHIYVDGASRGNPGPSAIAFSFYSKEGKLLYEHKQCIGKSTNNEAEYQAVKKSLEIAARYTKGNIFVYSDSELMVKQLNGIFKVKRQHLLELFRLVKKREKTFESVKYMHRPREHPKLRRVDSLANKALDTAF